MTAEVSKRPRTARLAKVFGTVVVSMLAIAGCVGQTSNGGNSGGGSKSSGSHTLLIARKKELIDTHPPPAKLDTCQIVFASTYQNLVTLANDNHTTNPEGATSSQ